MCMCVCRWYHLCEYGTDVNMYVHPAIHIRIHLCIHSYIHAYISICTCIHVYVCYVCLCDILKKAYYMWPNEGHALTT